MRKFLSASTPCKAGCKYCFAKRDDYLRQPALKIEQENIRIDEIILYPCCDGDFFDQASLVESVKKLADHYKKVYISLSSKIYPSAEHIKQLLDLNTWLSDREKGFVKFAISLSNRTMISDIEPGTMSYESRVSLAKSIKSIGLPLSLTIKPVLPFISEREYFSILEDFSPYLSHVLLGGLYVDQTSSFYRDYIQDCYMCAKRNVVWLSDHPDWDYVEDGEQMKKIEQFAKTLGMKVFTSDSLVVQSLIKEVEL